MRFRHSALAASLAVGLALTLAACDSDSGEVQSATFSGVQFRAQGAATLRPESDRLVVAGIGASGADGVAIAGDLDTAAVHVAPIRLPANGRFGMIVRGTDGRAVAEIAAQADASGGRHTVEFEFDAPLGVSLVQVGYFLGGSLVGEFQLRGATFKARAQPAGEGEGDSGSTHVVRDGGRYVVYKDYGDGDGGSKTGCPAMLTPPIAVPGLPDEVCVDLVRVAPVTVGGSFPSAIAGIEVVGRGLGEFAITDALAR